jgi:hypothetical protein
MNSSDRQSCGAEVAPIRIPGLTETKFEAGPKVLFAAAFREGGLSAEMISSEEPFGFRATPRLEHIMLRRQPHIVQTEDVKSNFSIRRLETLRTRPLLVFQSGYGNEDGPDHRLDRCTLRKACRVVSICQALSGKLQCWGVPASRIVGPHSLVKPLFPPNPLELEAARQKLALEAEVAGSRPVGGFSHD